MKKIGITGGIATGKTTFLNIIKSLGFPVFSSDEIVRELYKEPEIKAQLLKIFGQEILNSDGGINKNKILKKILENSELKTKLEMLFHPIVKKKLLEFFKDAEKNQYKIAFAEVPLLFEAGWQSIFDEIWVITCSKETQIKRIKEKGNYADLFFQLSEKQIPLEEKEKKAHRIFSSEKLPDELKKELKILLKEYLKG